MLLNHSACYLLKKDTKQGCRVDFRTRFITTTIDKNSHIEENVQISPRPFVYKRSTIPKMEGN